MSTRTLVFCFGSNMDLGQLRARCPAALVLGAATLAGHRVIFAGASVTWKGAVATLVREPTSVASGLLVSLDRGDRDRLDAFEGAPFRYRRVRRLLTDGRGRRLWAQTYVLCDDRVVVPPTTSYLRRILGAYLRLGRDPQPILHAYKEAYAMAGSHHRIFVYGTLLRGERNHLLLSQATYLGPARLPAEYRFVSFGGFPAVLPGGRTAITGEVYAVDDVTLAQLDRLEGHPRFYRRQRVRLCSGEEVMTYVMNEAQAMDRPDIATGDWRQHRKEIP